MGAPALAVADSGPLTSYAPPEPVPVAFLGRTSTLVMQDPAASLHRQVREVKAKLPPGWFIAAYYWDIESGGLDLAERGKGTAHLALKVGIPRDGGLDALLADAAGPVPRFAAVMCEDIERSGRDTFNALKLERQLAEAGIRLFAADEPISVEGMNASAILVRRVKQGVAEWFRFELKGKAWRGFEQHTIDGYNIGAPPHGYTGHRIPHPVPMKAAQGRTKTLLVLDPPRDRAIADIFAWRTVDKLGINTIVNKLNADPDTYPSPNGRGWAVTTVARILGNPNTPGTRCSAGSGASPAAAPAGSAPPRPSSGYGHRRRPTRPSSAARCGKPPKTSAPSTPPAPTTPAARSSRPPAAPTCCARGSGTVTATGG
jgi:site-specific DNA recombinase